MCTCNNIPCICSPAPEINCDPCLSDNSCKDKLDAKCISYKLDKGEDISNLKCFLDVDSDTSLEVILEKLDEKLCQLNSITGLKLVDNDCISWTKSISNDGVITFVPIVDYQCIIDNITTNVSFCQKVEDCAITPPSCSPVTSLQKLYSTTNTLTFTWGTVTGAASYEIKLFSDFNFTTQVGATQTKTHPTNTVTFTGLSANTPYYPQIRVNCSNSLNSSALSSGPFYTETVPELSCPSVTIDSVVVTDNSVVIDWTGGIGATSYNVYINNTLQSGMPTTSTTFTKLGLTNGNYSIKVEALPCVGTPQSDVDSFNINYNAPSITINCGGLTQIAGSFQQGLASSGTIRVPVTVVGTDAINVTVSGTGIIGSVTGYVVNNFTTYIDVPLTYNGSAPTGSRSITITMVGSVMASTNCTGAVVVSCPTCTPLSISTDTITNNGFTVNVSTLALGDTYDLTISEFDGPTVVTETGLSAPYVFTTGSALTAYTISVVRHCACGNTSTTSSATETTTGSTVLFEAINDTANNYINAVSPGFYYIDVNTFPVGPGQYASGGHSSVSSLIISVEIEAYISCHVYLVVNSSIVQSITVNPGINTYTSNPTSFAATDSVTIQLT